MANAVVPTHEEWLVLAEDAVEDTFSESNPVALAVRDVQIHLCQIGASLAITNDLLKQLLELEVRRG